VRADQGEVGPVLERLPLDAHDTAVTQETAQALCHRSWMIADDRADEFRQQLVALTSDEDAGVREEALRLQRPGSSHE
jgi:hypothetical protein